LDQQEIFERDSLNANSLECGDQQADRRGSGQSGCDFQIVSNRNCLQHNSSRAK
jgi:hypothetical protein